VALPETMHLCRELVRRRGAPSVAVGITPHQVTDEGCRNHQ